MQELRTKVKKLSISKNSTLIVTEDCVLEDIAVDGYVKLHCKGVVIRNKHYGKLVAAEPGDPDYVSIRGFKYQQ